MSHDGSSSPSISFVHGPSTQIGTITVVAFYPNGQPIGPNVAKFSSSIGSVVRMYVPPNYTKWKEVQNELKEQVWKHVCSLFDVPEYSRMWVLKKANDLWRDWKSALCCGVCDKFQTNAERITAIPKYVRKEDWQKFVEMCSMPEFIARRQLGKAARQEMKNPHTSGRKSQAMVADELRQQNPGEEITRTQVFLATHSRKDGTPLGQDTEGEGRGAYHCIPFSEWDTRDFFRGEATIHTSRVKLKPDNCSRNYTDEFYFV